MEEVLLISPPSSPVKATKLSYITCKQEADELSPKARICLNKNTDTEECIILDSDPLDSIDITKLSITITDDNDDHLSIVAEKGKVACRDYPHARHLCVRFPFDKTPHEKHCDLCYCYVCDSEAPCVFWWAAHCHASEHDEHWVSRRRMIRKDRSLTS